MCHARMLGLDGLSGTAACIGGCLSSQSGLRDAYSANVYYCVQAYGAEAPPQQMLWPDAVDQE